MYKPISSYAVIGNLHSVALVGKDGAIDWCCFPELDRGSVFAALLDHRKGGRFRIGMVGGQEGEQSYIQDSNVLCTTFSQNGAGLQVTDFMPLAGSIDGCCEASAQAPPEIVRLLLCQEGEAEVELEWSPRFDYARQAMDIAQVDGGWVARGAGESMHLSGVENGRVHQEENGPVLRARWRMRGGEERALVARWQGTAAYDSGQAHKSMQETVKVWRAWAHREGVVHSEEWAGEWLPFVLRSSLVCKMLTHAETGAIAAAPTTSLPEGIGGVRNWDYRFAWIRDASQTAQALVSLGHTSEAIDLLHWMERVSEAHAEDWELQIMYGVRGQEKLPEEELEHLEGYRSSRPVRIGNGAATQFQLEVYGELLNTGYELARRGEELQPHVMNFLHKVTEHVVQVWEEPDYGIWEMRGPPRHFTYSKVMAWVAMDRAVHLAEEYSLEGNVEVWRQTRQKIRQQILDKGYDRQRGAFVIAYGSKELDAANLRIPLMEFLPADDPRVQGTIDRTLEELTEEGLVYRYRCDDGIPGEEGAFGLCTFWLVDALALSGRVQEAEEIFTKLLGHANHVGLFPEQFDPATGEFLGNFPQAFTHIGLINSALYLAWAKGRPLPEHAPVGTPEHRQGFGRK